MSWVRVFVFSNIEYNEDHNLRIWFGTWLVCVFQYIAIQHVIDNNMQIAVFHNDVYWSVNLLFLLKQFTVLFLLCMYSPVRYLRTDICGIEQVSLFHLLLISLSFNIILLT